MLCFQDTKQTQGNTYKTLSAFWMVIKLSTVFYVHPAGWLEEDPAGATIQVDWEKLLIIQVYGIIMLVMINISYHVPIIPIS